MDYMFTQKELSYLDDVMPEITKKQTEDDNNADNGINTDCNSSDSNNQVEVIEI